MNDQHLSDEAVAACADGYLTGHARERATRHIARCAECAGAVRGQREAAWALRAAPAPALPANLLDRLRALPQTTSLTTLPTAIGPDGSTMLSTAHPDAPPAGPDTASFVPSVFAPMAALVAPPREPRHRARPFVAGAAVVALAGALAAVPAASSVAGTAGSNGPARRTSITDQAPGRPAPAVITPVSVFRTIGH